MLDVRASLRLRYVLTLGLAGALLSLVAGVVAFERQGSFESTAARITPMDESGTGYYLVEHPVEPVATTARHDRAYSGWLAVGVLAGTVVALGWWYAALQQRKQEQLWERFRRPRSTRPSARTLARRRELAAQVALDGQEQGRPRLTVRHVMTDGTLVAPPTASVQTLLNLLQTGPLRHVLICEFSGRLLGIVTDRDLRSRRGKRATDIMTREPVCVPPGALLGPAAALMVDHQVSCLPVVENNRVRGVLTSDDLVLALACLLQNDDANQARTGSDTAETLLLSTVVSLQETVRAVDVAPASVAPVEPAAR